MKKALCLLVLLFAGPALAGPLPCVPSGCSGQLCLEKGQNDVSTCESSPRYACYASVGVCARQPDGKCGWTPTDELSTCLTNANTRPPFLPPLSQ